MSMNLPQRIRSLVSNRFAVPAALLIVTILAYGLTFWRLGFYWDDQPISWIRYQLGPEATAHYFFDSRPVWAYLYQLTGYILPLKPAYWQLFAMFWRWAGVLCFWLVMERLFPQRKNLSLFLSLFVLLYPGFNQQWVSYLYSHFFIVLFFLLFSFYLMLRGNTIPAMVLSALNLLMLEYFFLLEFVRPLVIFKSLEDQNLTGRDRFVRTLRLWLPYLGVILFAVLYRSLVYTHPGFGYSLKDELLQAPVATLIELGGRILSSLWVTAVAAWLQAFQFPDPNVNGARTTALYAIVILVVGAIALLFRHSNSKTDVHNKRDPIWLIGLGVIMLMLGGVPFWVTNVPVSLGFPANRATLSFVFGACFFLMGLIELLPTRVKYYAAVLFVSLAAGRQFLWSVDFMRDWESQKDLFWQMTWRAPGLEPGTMVLMNEELVYNADNSISAALNWIYAPDNHGSRVDYVLFYPTNRIEHSLPELTPGIPIKFDYVAGQFNGNTSQAVVFYYSPPGCLRLLDPEIDSANRLIPDDTLLRDAALLSSTLPILTQETSRMPEIYDPEPAHGWCYYFEKADLARQLEDWEQVVELGDKAFALDDYPNDPVERFVFIEGYAHAGDWNKAREFSLTSYRVSENYVGPLLCSLWDRIGRETHVTSEQAKVLDEMRTKFECTP